MQKIKSSAPRERTHGWGAGHLWKFKFVDLGDLDWEREMELACPPILPYCLFEPSERTAEREAAQPEI
jgi:hypothetical protein